MEVFVFKPKEGSEVRVRQLLDEVECGNSTVLALKKGLGQSNSITVASSSVGPEQVAYNPVEPFGMSPCNIVRSIVIKRSSGAKETPDLAARQALFDHAIGHGDSVKVRIECNFVELGGKPEGASINFQPTRAGKFISEGTRNGEAVVRKLLDDAGCDRAVKVDQQLTARGFQASNSILCTFSNFS